jgi:hypothetical protein
MLSSGVERRASLAVAVLLGFGAFVLVIHGFAGRAISGVSLDAAWLEARVDAASARAVGDAVLDAFHRACGPAADGAGRPALDDALRASLGRLDRPGLVHTVVSAPSGVTWDPFGDPGTLPVDLAGTGALAATLPGGLHPFVRESPEVHLEVEQAATDPAGRPVRVRFAVRVRVVAVPLASWDVAAWGPAAAPPHRFIPPYAGTRLWVAATELPHRWRNAAALAWSLPAWLFSDEGAAAWGAASHSVWYLDGTPPDPALRNTGNRSWELDSGLLGGRRVLLEDRHGGASLRIVGGPAPEPCAVYVRNSTIAPTHLTFDVDASLRGMLVLSGVELHAGGDGLVEGCLVLDSNALVFTGVPVRGGLVFPVEPGFPAGIHLQRDPEALAAARRLGVSGVVFGVNVERRGREP